MCTPENLLFAYTCCADMFDPQFLCGIRNPAKELPSAVRQVPDCENILRLKYQITSSRLITPRHWPPTAATVAIWCWRVNDDKAEKRAAAKASHWSNKLESQSISTYTNINSTPTNTPSCKTTGRYYQSDVAPALLQWRTTHKGPWSLFAWGQSFTVAPAARCHPVKMESQSCPTHHIWFKSLQQWQTLSLIILSFEGRREL